MKTQACISLTILFLSLAGMSQAQQPVIPLSSGVAPGAENSRQKEVTFTAAR